MSLPPDNFCLCSGVPDVPCLQNEPGPQDVVPLRVPGEVDILDKLSAHYVHLREGSVETSCLNQLNVKSGQSGIAR